MNNKDKLPVRKKPAHPSPLCIVNRPTILFVTVCVAGRRPLLCTHAAHTLLLDIWHRADHWHIGRYVLMPDHIHFFSAPGNTETTFGRWIEYWRSTAAREWPVEAEKPLWQRDYWDRQLRKGDNYHEKWEYVRNNPVRAGLATNADDWPYQGELNELQW